MSYVIVRRLAAAVLLVGATSLAPHSPSSGPAPAPKSVLARARIDPDVEPLRVIRALPSDSATPNAQIRVTFDRPVAGSLDASVDPKTVLSVSPAVAGTLEWRDPVTVVLTPTSPMAAGQTYTVTVSNAFRAMDCAQLERPYTFTFRVNGARLIDGFPVSADNHPRQLEPDTKFDLVFSSPVEAGAVAAATYIQLAPTCAGEKVVRVRTLGVRSIGDKDNYALRDAGGYRRDRAADSLRRVVTIVPVTPLPLDCEGRIVAPLELDRAQSGPRLEWEFSTYGPLHIAEVRCAYGNENCPTGPISLMFSTPVRGSQVRRKVTLIPAVPFTMSDTSTESTSWRLDAELKPRSRYAVVVDTSIRDVFGQRLTGNPAGGMATTGYTPSVDYPIGRWLVEREGFGTFAVRHVNVDTLIISAALVPDSLEGPFLRNSEWSWATLWQRLTPHLMTVRIPVKAGLDRPTVTGVKLPAIVGPAGRRGLIAVRIAGPAGVKLDQSSNIALVQITNLAVHAKVGAASAVVWVTRVNDGQVVPNAAVTIHDPQGRSIATGRTDANGIATFETLVRPRVAAASNDGDDGDSGDESNSDGYVEVRAGDDRSLVGVSRYDPDLSPWQFGVYPAWGSQRYPLAGAVFTERGIYRPGEPLYAKAIVRRGALGALGSPAAGDSVRWIFRDRDEGVLKDTVVRLSSFGTSSRMITLPRSLALGYYRIELQYRWQGRWITLDGTGYRVAEYRPPEFLVDVSGPKATLFPNDSLRATVEARYLFGAPMGRAAFEWSAQRSVVSPWALDIPGLDDGEWYIGDSGWWWEDESEDAVETIVSGVDTLDAGGRKQVAIAVPAPTKGRAASVSITASVTDINRQSVASQTSVIVHPAEFYIAAKPTGTSYFWKAGERQAIQLIAVRPTGERVSGVAVRGRVVRREWHQVHRERDGAAEVTGEWVTDTVARCTVTTAAEPRRCEFTPALGGMYIVSFEARDSRGREARTSVYRWAEGSEWVPWEDESRFKMDVIADKSRYTVGDTATIMLASPFTNAQAWLTVEREGVIEQRRLTLNSGSTLVKLPITETFVPNAYVSVVVARGRGAPPGTLDDPGRPTMRIGYTELRVTPEVKRLTVKVRPLAAQYLPGDTARIHLAVADSRGAPRRAEVTLWAVDEGVLSLTGFRTPDPIDLLYQPRGLGLRLASNLVSVAPQIPEGEKGRRAPGGGGGAAAADVLRSRFKTTAFFLASVVTDAKGEAVAKAKLPDNLTTFRVMAVAATQTDRFGSGESKLLVTRAVVARPALPRFLRPGDDFTAGTVVNRRSGAPGPVTVQAVATGVELKGDAQQAASLEAGRGTEVRFPFRAPTTNAGDMNDTATFRFTATSGGDVDAVQSRLPFRPDYHPRSYTTSGVLHDTATAELILPKGIDPARSRVEISLGGSVLALIRGAYRELRVYPWYCTEQVTSAARPLLALYVASRSAGSTAQSSAPASAKQDLELAVRMLSERQRSDGGIGYWSAEHWTTPWLSAYAGLFLLDARDAGIAVDDSVLTRLGAFLGRSALATADSMPMFDWYPRRPYWLSERVAVADYLSRTKRPDVAFENRLIAELGGMRYEDRARLAEVVARRGATREAANILGPLWAAVKIQGRRAVLPDSALRTSGFYFESAVRPAARLLMATLATSPSHPLVGPLVENVVQQGRATRIWNTQDWAMAVEALSAFERKQLAATEGTIRATAQGHTLVEGQVNRTATRDSSIALTGLLGNAPNDARSLRVSLSLSGAPSGVAFYYVTVREVPLQRPVRPDDHGVAVERWYERYDTRAPTTSATEGELVRVRLRITVPEDREFLVLDDALPAGLEAVDLSLRTVALMPGPGAARAGGTPEAREAELGEERDIHWGFGSWDSGWWTPFDYRELRDDRVVYFATRLWKGTYTATYIARATTPGTFVRPPTHAEEMYNPAVFGRSDGGVFTVKKKQ